MEVVGPQCQPAEYEEHTERWGWSGYREEVGSRVVDRIQNAGPSLDLLCRARAKLLRRGQKSAEFYIVKNVKKCKQICKKNVKMLKCWAQS